MKALACLALSLLAPLVHAEEPGDSLRGAQVSAVSVYAAIAKAEPRAESGAGPSTPRDAAPLVIAAVHRDMPMFSGALGKESRGNAARRADFSLINLRLTP